MARNQLAVRGGKQFTGVDQILNNPSQRAKLQNYIDEAVRCKIKIMDEQESIKTLRQSAVEELNIEPKMFSRLISLFYNNNFEQQQEEAEKIEALLVALKNNDLLP